MPKILTTEPYQPKHSSADNGHLPQFAIACLALSWLPWAALKALNLNVDDGVAALVFAFAASGPSLAALVMWMRYRDARIPTHIGAPWVWPVAALGLGAVPPVVAALCMNAAAIPHHAASTIAGVGGPLGALAYTLISGPLSEEFGWRGYVQPRLRRRLGRIATTAVIGIGWGLWHLPLFFLTGTGQHDMGLSSVKGVLFFVSLFPLSYTFLFVSERLRGGVWAAVLIHAAWNLTDALVPPYGNGGAYLQTGLMCAVAVCVALFWRRRPGVSPFVSVLVTASYLSTSKDTFCNGVVTPSTRGRINPTNVRITP